LRSREVAKPEWGTKRICPSCGTRYYDFGKALGEIECPKCQTKFDPEAFLKTRRARTPAVAEKEVAPLAADEIDPEIETEEVEAEEVEAAEGEEEDEAVTAEGEEEEEEEIIEDASELGEDDTDMAEVIENVEDEEER
jgi:uncharacterized protein (TIGR02300 family)